MRRYGDAGVFSGIVNDVFNGPGLSGRFLRAQDYYVALGGADFDSWDYKNVWVRRCQLTHCINAFDGVVISYRRNFYGWVRCKLLHKKASLAVLSDEANAHLFDAAEQNAIDAYVPWTRLLVERRTMVEGQKIDLLPFLADHKDDFVLKPNDEYGGKGIVLGWEVGQSEWDEALRARLAEPTIVQRRVALPTEPHPSLVDGRVQIIDRMLDTNPYIWYGAYVSGCLTRLSTAALLNVTAGGGSTVPTFVVEKRD